MPVEKLFQNRMFKKNSLIIEYSSKINLIQMFVMFFFSKASVRGKYTEIQILIEISFKIE